MGKDFEEKKKYWVSTLCVCCCRPRARRAKKIDYSFQSTTSYPTNMFSSAYYPEIAATYQETADLGSKYEWENLVHHLENKKFMINSTRLSNENDSPPTLFTPLHYAAEGKAPKETFEALLKLGASRCLKTADGETAFDIGKRQGLSPDILELIRIPEEIEQDKSSIEAMEVGLHQVINGRVENLIIEHGLQLPQLAFLFEFGGFYYCVPGMYGGFHVEKNKKGIATYSFIRICGGSDEFHLIERDGKVTLQLQGDG